jgi:hypothetical protein
MQVEVDLLTGAITIIRSDLIYDCGKSLNPAVDLGQVCQYFPFKLSFLCLSINIRVLVTQVCIKYQMAYGYAPFL